MRQLSALRLTVSFFEVLMISSRLGMTVLKCCDTRSPDSSTAMVKIDRADVTMTLDSVLRDLRTSGRISLT
ncbi:hypothetical protein OGAPHI_003758 [Ogataea philodendri]|uniref:Secreted protein n=1 Tax=Ogataea philodendri TaxID=1378263 RepID=A0A9P8T559_9ASCO|nr:uncharacterized protein OGAPHI_003758 [Ogataea philodendri]KAH3665571.1 hypothetical protein OGAPHI_003758 [Ogataea philodendri]